MISRLFLLLLVAGSVSTASAQDDDPFSFTDPQPQDQDDPFAPAEPNAPAREVTTGEIERMNLGIAVTTFAVNADALDGLLAKESGGEIYRHLVDAFTAGQCEIVAHSNATTSLGTGLESEAKRNTSVPDYFNMLHLDWAQRYNPRDTGGPAVGTALKVEANIDRDRSTTSTSLTFTHAPGPEVMRSYGARIVGTGHMGWPNCFELPALPINSIFSNLDLPLGGDPVLASITRPILPHAGKTDTWETADIYHLTFARAVGLPGDGQKAPPPATLKHRQVWAAVYEIERGKKAAVKSFADLPPNSQRVDFTMISTRDVGFARSSASYFYPDALYGREDAIEGDDLISDRRQQIKPFDNQTGIEAARASFSQNARPRLLALGTEFFFSMVNQADGAATLEFKFRRTVRAPALVDAKLALPIRDGLAGAPKRWAPAYLQQFKVNNEESKGDATLSPGKVAGPFPLGADTEHNTVRLLFIGER